MLKIIPYEQYEVCEIERWLNFQSEKGYRLNQLYGGIAKFEKIGARVYYRVKYIPANKQCANTLYWGDLYVYQSETLEDLPKSNCKNDMIMAAKKVAIPSVFDVVAYIVSIILFFRTICVCFDYRLYLLASAFLFFVVAYSCDLAIWRYKAYCISKRKRNYASQNRKTFMPFAISYFIIAFILQFGKYVFN